MAAGIPPTVARGRSAATGGGTQFKLRVRSETESRTHRLEGECWIVGRDPDCDVQVDEPGFGGRQFELVAEGDAIVFRDLAGGAMPLRGGRPCRDGRLRSGETLEICGTLLTIERVEGRLPVEADPHNPHRAARELAATAPRPSIGVPSALGVRGSLHDVCNAMLEASLERTGFERGAVALLDNRGRAHVIAANDHRDLSVAAINRARNTRDPFLAETGEDATLVVPLGEGDGVIVIHASTGEADRLEAAATQLGKLSGVIWARVEDARERAALRDELQRLRYAQSASSTTVLASARLAAARRQLRLAAGNAEPVFLLGAEGTEKEDLAQFQHVHGPQAAATFVAFHPAVVPHHRIDESLADAIATATGNGESNGTLYIEQPELLPEIAQERLVRALAGDSETRPCCAFGSHRTPTDEAKAGRLLPALADLIQSNRVTVPPLSSNPGDVNTLTELLLGEMGPSADGAPRAVTEGARQALLRYAWPGNVRELRRVLEAAAARAGTRPVAPRHLPPEVRSAADGAAPQISSLKEVERNHIVRVLEAVGWSKRKASKVLGIAPSTLYEKLARYQIQE